MNGTEMYALAERLYPICRSLTGEGVRESLRILKEYVPELQIHEVPTGTKAYDWEIPMEWEIKEGYIEDSNGRKIIDFAENNLHIMGYSEPVDLYVSKEKLLEYIYVEESRPNAIPYVTSYYKARCGFCMSKNQRDSLKDDTYHIYIDSRKKKGSMTYAEMILPPEFGGKAEKEIFFSTYICHPSMGNNELSGPCLMVALINEIKKIKNRRYTYRFLIAPETIGAIYYISRNLDVLKRRMAAGYVLSCVGDNRVYSYVPSREGNTLADRVARIVLNDYAPDYIAYSFLERASDERQYCAPGVDLPVCVVCRSKYGCYPEYHTSDDDMTLISPEGFEGSLELYKRILLTLEYNAHYRVTCMCEPQLGKRGLYPTVSKKNSYDSVTAMLDFLAYADGKRDLVEISEVIHQPVEALIPVIDKLISEKLIEVG